MRIVNASADTMFRVALGEHTFAVTHTDGFPVQRRAAQSLLLGMAERVDAIVELGDGVFPLVAKPEGKHGLARALVRTGDGRPPSADARPAELQTCPLLGTDFVATDDVTLDGTTDRTHDLVLTGDMMRYVWKINGAVFGEHAPLPVHRGDGVRLRFENKTMMPHPMHLHGHTFQVINSDGSPGARKDTAIVPAKHPRGVRHRRQPRRLGCALPQRVPRGRRDDDTIEYQFKPTRCLVRLSDRSNSTRTAKHDRQHPSGSTARSRSALLRAGRPDHRRGRLRHHP